MKTLVIYMSVWGSTEDYATWLAEKLENVVLKSAKSVSVEDIQNSELIIFGSRTYMGQIQIVPFIKSNWEILKDKRLYLFAVGMIPWNNSSSKKAYEEIPEYIRNKLLGYRKLPGKIEMEKLNSLEKMIVNAQRSSVLENLDRLDRKNLEMIMDDLKELGLI